jgi:hypothetical protein
LRFYELIMSCVIWKDVLLPFTSQETHYVCVTKPNRLMLFREINAVYCEDHTEHINTLWAECRVQVMPHRKTHYVSITKPNRLMLFREIIAVYCENHMEHINTLCGQNAEFSSCLTRNTLRLRYKAIIAVDCENHMQHTLQPFHYACGCTELP